MNNQVVLFGNREIAEIAHFYLSKDSDYQVKGFTVDSQFLDSESFLGLPVVPFEQVEIHFQPSNYKMFIAISYSKRNLIRQTKFEDAKNRGFKFITYISSKAAYYGTPVGDNCFILEHNTIQPFTQIGNNVTLWSGNHIGHHSVIKDHCFITSHVCISGGVEIGENCFIGVNATLRDHIKVGDKSIIGAGVLLMEDAPSESLYTGSASQRAKVSSSRIKSI